jgi:TatA/E family protein of Tat protein translocase
MPTSLGPAEILVIFVVALIVLGPNKLPEAGRQVGKAIAEVRKWSQGFQDEIRTVVDPNVPPSYPRPTPPPTGAGDAPGPATPSEAEYTGPRPELAAPSGNGSAPEPVEPSEPSEPPPGEPPRS